MKVLITGAAGFLGLHLTNFLYGKGEGLILLDIAKFDEKEYPNKAKNKRGLQYVIGDVRDIKVMDGLISQSDIVIHAAAALPLWKKEEIFSINVDGTKNVLELSLKHKIKHFIYISSTAVYGVPKVHPIYENAPMVGVGSYGQSKIDAEKTCLKYRKKGLVVTVVRPKTFVGTHRLGVFEILFDWVKDSKRIPVIGSGNNLYQLLDVDDLVQAIYLFYMLKDKSVTNDAFNIGAVQYDTVTRDLREVFRKVNSKSGILPLPAWPIKRVLWLFDKIGVSPLYQWIYDTADKDSFVSIDKLINTLDFVPLYSNSEALIKSYNWYIQNYDEIKSKPAGLTHTVGWDQGILKFFKKFL